MVLEQHTMNSSPENNSSIEAMKSVGSVQIISSIPQEIIQTKSAELQQNGFFYLENFLNTDELAAIRKEVDFLFSKNLIHGPGFSVFINPRRQEIPQAPSKITSVNLFEKAIDLIDMLRSGDAKRFKSLALAHIAVYKENKNPHKLTWHSDVREGALLRMQIVLKGGQENSGALCYVRGSHTIPNISYLPPEGYLKQHKQDIVKMAMPNGTALVMNTLGYHSRCPVETERISIMFDFVSHEFIEQNKNDIGSNLLISFHQLTDKIIKKLDYLRINIAQNAKNPNTPDHYNYSLKFGGFHMRVLKPLYLLKNKLTKGKDY